MTLPQAAQRKESRKLKNYGVMHFSIDCDIFVAPRKEYLTAQEFLKAAMAEDAGYELAEDKLWNEAEAFNNLLPYVKDDAFIVHRVGYCPSDTDLDDWWEFVRNPGRGHMKVWYLDIHEIEDRQAPSSTGGKGE